MGTQARPRDGELLKGGNQNALSLLTAGPPATLVHLPRAELGGALGEGTWRKQGQGLYSG